MSFFILDVQSSPSLRLSRKKKEKWVRIWFFAKICINSGSSSDVTDCQIQLRLRVKLFLTIFCAMSFFALILYIFDLINMMLRTNEVLVWHTDDESGHQADHVNN